MSTLYKHDTLILGAAVCFLGVSMRVRIDYRGRIKGIDRVITEIMRSEWGIKEKKISFQQADEVCEQLRCLLRETVELAWICMENAESSRYTGYELEIFVTERGITWQRYQTEAAPPPLPLLLWRHSLARFYHLTVKLSYV